MKSLIIILGLLFSMIPITGKAQAQDQPQDWQLINGDQFKVSQPPMLTAQLAEVLKIPNQFDLSIELDVGLKNGPHPLIFSGKNVSAAALRKQLNEIEVRMKSFSACKTSPRQITTWSQRIRILNRKNALRFYMMLHTIEEKELSPLYVALNLNARRFKGGIRIQFPVTGTINDFDSDIEIVYRSLSQRYNIIPAFGTERFELANAREKAIKTLVNEHMKRYRCEPED